MCVGTEVRDADSEKRRHVTHEGQRATQADGRMKKEQSAGKKTKALLQHGVRANASPTQISLSQYTC